MLEAPRSTANSVDSITKPPLDFKSVLNVVPERSKPSPGVYVVLVAFTVIVVPVTDVVAFEPPLTAISPLVVIAVPVPESAAGVIEVTVPVPEPLVVHVNTPLPSVVNT